MILVNTFETINMASVGSKPGDNNALYLAAETKDRERGGCWRGCRGREAAFQPEDL